MYRPLELTPMEEQCLVVLRHEQSQNGVAPSPLHNILQTCSLLLPIFLQVIAKVLTGLEGTNWATFIGKFLVQGRISMGTRHQAWGQLLQTGLGRDFYRL